MELGNAANSVKLALTRLDDALIALSVEGIEKSRAVAKMRDVQRAYIELLEVMEYPVDQNGHSHDLNAVMPSVLGIAWTAALYGFRRTADPLIKKRRLPNEPGAYDNACAWVSIDAPDSDRDLRPGDYTADRILPPSGAGVAGDPEDGPTVIAEWHTTAAVTYVDEPRPKGY